MTYLHPWYTQQQLLENTTTCVSESTQKPAKETPGHQRTDLNVNQLGDIAEIYVSLIAQWKGARIHRNVSCVGDTDMVLQIEDSYHPIDVKLARWLRGGSGHYSWSSTNATQVKLPVYPVLVVPEGDIMDWKIKWRNLDRSRNSAPLCPTGLETFWNKPSTNV